MSRSMVLLLGHMKLRVVHRGCWLFNQRQQGSLRLFATLVSIGGSSLLLVGVIVIGGASMALTAIAVLVLGDLGAAATGRVDADVHVVVLLLNLDTVPVVFIIVIFGRLIDHQLSDLLVIIVVDEHLLLVIIIIDIISRNRLTLVIAHFLLALVKFRQHRFSGFEIERNWVAESNFEHRKKNEKGIINSTISVVFLALTMISNFENQNQNFNLLLPSLGTAGPASGDSLLLLVSDIADKVGASFAFLGLGAPSCFDLACFSFVIMPQRETFAGRGNSAGGGGCCRCGGITPGGGGNGGGG